MAISKKMKSRNFFKVIIFSAFLVLVSSCSSYQPPKDYDFDKTKVFNKDYDYVWNKVVEWFSENNTPIKNMEKASGIITTEFNLNASNSGYIDCGKDGFVKTIKNERGNFNVLVQKVEQNKTKVTLNVFFEATMEVANFSGGPPQRINHECKSTGKLENEIFNFIQGN